LLIWEIILAFALPNFTSIMSFTRIAAIAGVVAFLTASKVTAHGTVTGIVADGV
jgi:hypothetical protein